MTSLPFLIVYERLPEGVLIIPDPLSEGEEKKLTNEEFEKLKALMPGVQLWIDITKD